MSIDFSQLLSTKVEDAKRPPVKPAGTYHAVISDHKFDVTKPPKNTPFCQFSFTGVRPGEDIDPDQLKDGEGNQIDFAKWKPRTQGLSNFYLTPDAIFRLREFMEGLGIETAGRSWNETIPETRGMPVLLTVSMRASEDGQSFYNQIDRITADKS